VMVDQNIGMVDQNIGMVDQNIGMVDQNIGMVDPMGLPESLKLPYIFFIYMTAVDGTKRREDNKKLTRVISTKLSIEDHKAFRVLTNLTYQYGGIKEDSPSEMLRFIITSAVSLLHNRPGFSLI
jgi:hypothetical protein